LIKLAPLATGDVARVMHLLVKPEQLGFVHHIKDMVREVSPKIDFHQICGNAAVVGFFKIDRAYAMHHDFAKASDLGLRGFLIGAQYQRRGIGSDGMLKLRGYLVGHYPDFDAAFLTVNVENETAHRLYFRAGFRDTGELYRRGDSGPQHVMRLKL